MIELLEKLAELDPEFCKIERDFLGIRSITLGLPLTKTWGTDEIRSDRLGFRCHLQAGLLERLVYLGLRVCADMSNGWRVDAFYPSHPSQYIDGKPSWQATHYGHLDPTSCTVLLNTLIGWLEHKAETGREGDND